MINKLITLFLLENKSLNDCSRTSLLIKELNNEISNQIKLYENVLSKFKQIFEIINLLSLINSARCDNYDDWIKVGICLHNIDINYLLLWDKWSSQSSKYKVKYCEKVWKSFKMKNINSLDILHEMAFNDNPNKYIKIYGDMALWLD